MALKAQDVQIAVTGEVYLGPFGATAITAGTGPIPDVYTGLGYLSEDGIVEERESDSKDIKGWQNHDTVRVLDVDGQMTLKIKVIQKSATVIEAFYGTEVSQTDTGGTYDIRPTVSKERRAMVVEIVDGDNIERSYAPHVVVAEVGEVERISTDVTGYEMTLRCLADQSLKGACMRRWDTALALPAQAPVA